MSGGIDVSSNGKYSVYGGMDCGVGLGLPIVYYSIDYGKTSEVKRFNRTKISTKEKTHKVMGKNVKKNVNNILESE